MGYTHEMDRFKMNHFNEMIDFHKEQVKFWKDLESHYKKYPLTYGVDDFEWVNENIRSHRLELKKYRAEKNKLVRRLKRDGDI